MLNVKKHLEMLGFRVEDKVTGFQGVVTTVTFDLYGCIQALVHPGKDEHGKLGEQAWFDISRLKVSDQVRVMDVPDFDLGPVAEGKKGAAEKPATGKA